MNLGFYYMANAGGRLIGTVLSGWAYQVWGWKGAWGFRPLWCWRRRCCRWRFPTAVEKRCFLTACVRHREAESPLSPALLPDPLRLIGPTIGSTPVGRFKRSGTGKNLRTCEPPCT